MRILTIVTAAVFAGVVPAVAGEMSDMDTNADGVLSVEEFATGHADVDPAVFTEIDANEDGLIDPVEYAAAKAEGGPLADG